MPSWIQLPPTVLASSQTIIFSSKIMYIICRMKPKFLNILFKRPQFGPNLLFQPSFPVNLYHYLIDQIWPLILLLAFAQFWSSIIKFIDIRSPSAKIPLVLQGHAHATSSVKPSWIPLLLSLLYSNRSLFTLLKAFVTLCPVLNCVVYMLLCPTGVPIL